jgi:hypothetical protein
VLCVDLVGSRPIWPAHVGRVVDPEDTDRSRRIAWMIKQDRQLGRVGESTIEKGPGGALVGVAVDEMT